MGTISHSEQGSLKLIYQKNLNMNFATQLFYLKLNERDGYFVSANLSVGKSNFPISFGSTMYKTFNKEIGGKDFNWNVSLFYSFNKKYTAQ